MALLIVIGSGDSLSLELSLGPLLGIPEGNEDENIDGISDKIFDGTLLGPELGVIDGNQL